MLIAYLRGTYLSLPKLVRPLCSAEHNLSDILKYFVCLFPDILIFASCCQHVDFCLTFLIHNFHSFFKDWKPYNTGPPGKSQSVAYFKEISHMNKIKGKSVEWKSSIIQKPPPMKLQVNQLEIAHKITRKATSSEQYVMCVPGPVISITQLGKSQCRMPIRITWELLKQ